MVNAIAEGFELPGRMLLYVIPPIIVIGGASILINSAGFPLDHLANATVQNGHAEAAGRLRMLATWLLLACVGIGCIGHFAWSLLVARRTAPQLAVLYVLLAAGGILLIASGGMEGAQRLMDRRVICAAFDLAEAPEGRVTREATETGGSRRGTEVEVLKTYGPPGPHVGDDASACGLSKTNYPRMWWLNQIQKYLLVLFIPALVLGMISCTARPAAPSEDDCRLQVRRLNLQLYLTATALVSGLLFLSALLHWPGFAFQGEAAAAYKAHVDAYILYWGVAYTLFIAAVYVPVAIELTLVCNSLPTSRNAEAEQGEKAKATPVTELFSLLKTAAAMFAPAIAGLLGGVINI
jgi:hypothetical protein